MTTLQMYAIISPLLGLAMVGFFVLSHNRQHARFLKTLPEQPSSGGSSGSLQSAMPRRTVKV